MCHTLVTPQGTWLWKMMEKGMNVCMYRCAVCMVEKERELYANE